MANLELDVIRAVVRKTFIIGLVALSFSWWYAGATLGIAVVFGVVVAASNLLFVAWLSKKVIGDGAGLVGKGGWMVLSVLKMSILFGLVWLLIARLELDAIGFVIGFSCFLPAMVWQALDSFDVDTSDPDA
jgi:hypothetical protein